MKNKSLLVWVMVSITIVLLLSTFSQNNMGGNEISYNEMVQKIEQGGVKSAVIYQNSVIITPNEGEIRYRASTPESDAYIRDALLKQGVDVKFKKQSETSVFDKIFVLLPILLIFALIWFVMKQMGGSNGRGGVMGVGRSKAKLLTPDQKKVTFQDVAGIDEAKVELTEVVEFLKEPEKFQRLGGRIPKGCLLVGPPGTGKTLLAKAVAGEAGVPFFAISGSDFVEMFVGVGASRVRDMFEQGKKNAPCIIFIDEIDAVGRHRGAGLGGGNDEREQTLNQILVEMDGFDSNDGVILIAATNRPDVLDPALLRPGRFDRQVVVPYPDILGREQILHVHLRNIKVSKSVDTHTIAKGSIGFSGADIANLVNEAALFASRRNHEAVEMEDFEKARDKILMGPERRSMVMEEKEKKLTAWHEAGHALIEILIPEGNPLHKVTIIPRGRALGVTMSLPDKDELSISKKKLESRLVVLFGGRIAEELVFGSENITTGASNDIQQATSLARKMVMEWGFSEHLGRIRYASNEQEVFLGHSVAQQQNMSEETAQLIDREVRNIIEHAEARAREILSENFSSLEKITEALLEYETLSGNQVKDVIEGKAIFHEEDGHSYGSSQTSKTSIPTFSATGFQTTKNDKQAEDSNDKIDA